MKCWAVLRSWCCPFWQLCPLLIPTTHYLRKGITLKTQVEIAYQIITVHLLHWIKSNLLMNQISISWYSKYNRNCINSLWITQLYNASKKHLIRVCKNVRHPWYGLYTVSSGRLLFELLFLEVLWYYTFFLH